MSTATDDDNDDAIVKTKSVNVKQKFYAQIRNKSVGMLKIANSSIRRVKIFNKKETIPIYSQMLDYVQSVHKKTKTKLKH